MDKENFQAFLDDQRERGALDGSGGFTVNFSKAKLKLAKYQMDHPAGYLLKFVQAAVLYQARKMEITCGSKEVTVRFVEPRSQLTPEKFLELLQNPPESHESVRHQLLAYALNSAPADGMALEDNLEGHRVAVKETAQRTKAALLKGGGFRFLFARPEPAGARRCAEEQQAVWQRCQLCPIPVAFDGALVNVQRRLVPFYEDQLRPDHEVFAAESHRAETDRSGVGVPRRDRKAGYLKAKESVKQRSRWDIAVALRDSPLPKKGATDRARSVVLFPLKRSRQSILHLVQYGVVLETKNFPSPFGGAVAALCVDGMATDLSGLQVRESRQLKNEISEVEAQSRELLSFFKEFGPGVTFREAAPSGDTGAATAAVTGVVGAFVGFAVGGPFGSLVGGGMGATLGAVTGSAVKQPSPEAGRGERIESALRRLLGELSRA